MKDKENAVQLPTEQINPRILNSYLFSSGMEYKKGEPLPKRIVKAYELEFFLESSGGMYIDQKWYDVRPGDIVFRRPKESTQAVMPYSCYIIYFDINNSLTPQEIPLDICSQSNDVPFQENYNNLIINTIPTLFHPISSELYQRLFEDTLTSFIQCSEVHKLTTKVKLLQILSNLYNEVKNPIYTLDKTPYGRLIEKTLDYIHNNIKSQITLYDLANIASLSPNYYHVIFKRIMNTTPHEYIIEARLKKAKELLAFSNKSIYEISDDCGFISSAYFSYFFKKKLNISPTTYRNQYRLDRLN